MNINEYPQDYRKPDESNERWPTRAQNLQNDYAETMRNLIATSRVRLSNHPLPLSLAGLWGLAIQSVKFFRSSCPGCESTGIGKCMGMFITQ